MITETHKRIDKEIFKNCVDITTYLGVINEKEEMERFFEEKEKYRPKFKYPALDFKPEKCIENLKKAKKVCENDEIGELQERKIEELVEYHKMLLNRDNPEEFFNHSLNVFGKPEKTHIRLAEKVIEECVARCEARCEEKFLTSDDVEKSVNEVLKRYNLLESGWKIVRAKRSIVNVDSKKKIIQIPDPSVSRKFGEMETKKLRVHEIFGHVFRGENGTQQPLPAMFSLGFPNYLPCEEGLACYLEKIYGVASKNAERIRAGYVVAVDNLCNGYDFYEIYRDLRERGFSERDAWRITMRIFRGGGFTKDICYFVGERNVEKYFEEVGKKKALQLLYLGKTNLEDMNLCEKLLKSGVLKKPKYLPPLPNIDQ